MKQTLITIALGIIMVTNLQSKPNVDQLPLDAQDYIYSQDYPAELIEPINALSPKAFQSLLEELSTSTRVDKQNIIIETIR